MHVLVVDDEPSIRASLGRVLTHGGHQVTLVGSGQDALRAIADDMTIGVVVLDINLGEGQMSGYDVAGLMPRRLPIIVLSGLDPLAIRDGDRPTGGHSLEAAIVILGKPVDPPTLLRHLERLEPPGPT